MGGTKSVGPMWPHWENQLTKAKREGVIEGLGRALDLASGWHEAGEVRFEIAAVLKRLRAEQKEG